MALWFTMKTTIVDGVAFKPSDKLNANLCIFIYIDTEFQRFCARKQRVILSLFDGQFDRLPITDDLFTCKRLQGEKDAVHHIFIERLIRLIFNEIQHGTITCGQGLVTSTFISLRCCV